MSTADKGRGVLVRTVNPPIDRRPAGKNASAPNRARFVKRHHGQLRKAVKDAILERGIREVGKDGEDVRIPRKNIKEPIFGHGSGGTRETVHPGNERFVTGDLIKRPEGGGKGGGGGEASNSGEGEDDFIFHLTKEEFMQIFFEDLALPNWLRLKLTETLEYVSRRAGFTSDGAQSNLALLRSMRSSIGRRIVLHKADRKRLIELLEDLDQLESVSTLGTVDYVETHTALTDEITILETKVGHDPVVEARRTVADRILAIEAKLRAIPYIDPIDLRYRTRVKVPLPTSKAVMFCLMDVSGSMDEQRKDLAKRFFILLHLFLTRHYERIDVVFIRHHTEAREVDEEEFFRAKDSGGTVVSTCLVLMEEIIKKRYGSGEWNIYGAQASDGDNSDSDNTPSRDFLQQKLLPLCRYFAYVQVVKQEQSLWKAYSTIPAGQSFAMRKVEVASDIYPVFRELFKKKEGSI